MCWHHTITGERGTSKVALALTIHTQIYHNKKAHTKDNKAKQSMFFSWVSIILDLISIEFFIAALSSLH